MSDVVKGVEWAAEAHIKKSKKKDPKFKGSAANMSLGGGKVNIHHASLLTGC
jgi:cerevisin